MRLTFRARLRARVGVAAYLHVAALGELDDHAAPAVDVADDVAHVLLRRRHVHLGRG